ncbi:MAG TPA: hypothetical protein VGN00_15285 [Puia sp.]|jgi:hypothetical protein
MFFATFILIRILLITCMVFVLGYVFGNFSRKPSLTKITRVAAVFLVVSFIAGNALFFRWSTGGRYGHFNRHDRFQHHCERGDSATSGHSF